MKYKAIYFTPSLFFNPPETDLVNLLTPFIDSFISYPGLLVPERRYEIEAGLEHIQEFTDCNFLFLGFGLHGFWANYFANQLLAPRILFDPIENPYEFFLRCDNITESKWVKDFDEDLDSPSGVPGLIFFSSDTNYSKELHQSYQIETINNGWDFSPNSCVAKTIVAFINDLERIAI